MLDVDINYKINDNSASEDVFSSVSLPEVKDKITITTQDNTVLLVKNPDILKTKALAGDPEAQYELGNTLYESKDFEAAFSWLLKAAQQGFPKAQCKVANMYYDGTGVHEDLDLAIDWYLRAANGGDPEAQYKVAKLYMYGDIESEDDNEVTEWLTKSAEQGYSDAICQLYERNYYNNDRDRVAAEYWLKKGAELGFAWAQYELGRLFKDEGNDELAVYWLEKAAAQDHLPAVNELGDMYFYGNGVYKDEGQALKYYNQALGLGDESAQKSIDAVYFDIALANQPEI